MFATDSLRHSLFQPTPRDIVRVQIIHLDERQQKPTDFYSAMPYVAADIDVAFRSGFPNLPRYRRVMGVIDTGASCTVLCNRLLEGQTPDYHVEGADTAGVSQIGIYRALIKIIGFNNAHLTQVASKTLGTVDMLIGRDLLQYYRLVYDTPGKEFYLEERLDF